VKAKTFKIILATFLIALVLGIYIGQSQTPTSTFHISPGPYPVIPTYMIWREGNNYFAKTKYGELKFSGINASQIINNAIDSTYSSGGGVVLLKSSTSNYIITHPIIMKENVRLVGEVDSKVDQPSVQIKPSSTFSGNAMIKTNFVYVTDANSPDALTQCPELFDLTLNGEGNVNVGVNFTNVDTARFERVRIAGVSTGITIEYYGVLPIPASGSTYNGFFMEKCIITASDTSIYAEYATQSWIVNNWFVGGANRHIELKSCTKLRVLGNELNSFRVSGINLVDTNDDEMNEILISNNWLYTEYAAKYFIFDLANRDTRRIKIDNNILAYTAAERPHKTDFPDNIPASSFSGNMGTKSYSEQRGKVTIPAGSTSVTVFNELLRTPRGVVVTSSNNTRTGNVWVISLDVGTFIIKSEKTVPADTEVYWFAWVYP